MSPRSFFGWTLLALSLAGCASNVPAPIRDELPTAPSVAEVRADPGRFVGSTVRWGGVIVATRNEAEDSVVEIVQRDLDGSGRPKTSDRSEGRFLARVRGFLEPTIFAQGREFTVTGRLAAPQPGAIGARPYDYPVVDAETYYLWPELPPPDYDPYWYDPWYPWYPYPWRYRPYPY